jgi:hypothetical protein
MALVGSAIVHEKETALDTVHRRRGLAYTYIYTYTLIPWVSNLARILLQPRFTPGTNQDI